LASPGVSIHTLLVTQATPKKEVLKKISRFPRPPNKYLKKEPNMCTEVIATLQQLDEVRRKHAPQGGAWIRLDRFVGVARTQVLKQCKLSEDGLKVKV
jgi:hypothetical protein